MNDIEFEVMDHLYFVTSFEELKELSNLDEKELVNILLGLIRNGWVKCYADPDNEINISEAELKTNYYNYEYLATKRGLLAHNRR